MKKILFTILISLILLPTISLHGQTPVNDITRFFFAYTTESITIDSTAGGKAFTTTKIKQTTTPYYKAQLASFRVECSASTPCPIRFTVDGTAPTTSVGTVLNESDTLNIYAYDNILKFRAIRTGSNSAIIQPTYYR